MTKVVASTYEIIEKIGAGGGGKVYLANHLRLNKKVVLKADKRKITTRPELLRREVDILKDLRHSHIPQVYDFFVEDDTVYTVMDYIEGESLDKPLKKGERFSQPQVIIWAKQLLGALSYLHSPTHGDPPRGFVHSDIKPANLMVTPYNDICLIDFNIALALGEENVIGRSAGYASPEHYGSSFISVSSTGLDSRTETLQDTDETVTIVEQSETVTLSELQSKTEYKKFIPDVRSDIYSVGATLYHLLSGKRPAKFAADVIQLSEKEFSGQVVKIISKAMNPNPELRYQTADEMLYDFNHLHENDSRTKHLKRKKRIACGVTAVLFCVGLTSAFVGLKRMQAVEKGLKLAEYSQKALAQGDKGLAIQYALDAIPQKTNLITPEGMPEAQKALTDALGVYALSDDFKSQGIVDLPEDPLYLRISPDGRTGVCLCKGSFVVFKTESMQLITTLPAVDSALAEMEYLDNDTIIYAGEKGVSAYCISKNLNLWQGNPATAVSVSQDGRLVATVYKDESRAIVYDASTGQMIREVDFMGRKQNVTMVSDSFANPNDNLFEINSGGTLLAASFDDGSMVLFSLSDEEEELEVLNELSGYQYFEGGFCGDYLAFSASGVDKSIFAIIDGKEKKQTVGFESDSTFHALANGNGIYVQTKNVLVKMDPLTGEQTPLVTTDEMIRQFSVGNKYTVIATDDRILFFDMKANLITEMENQGMGDMLQSAEKVVISGTIDTPEIQITRYEEHTQEKVLEYDPSLEHAEARISADGKTVMLFSFKRFYILNSEGNLVSEMELPNPNEVYDQQFIRKNRESYLEVTYKDGEILTYDAGSGTLISQTTGEKPDMTLDEEFHTKNYQIEAPLHGAPQVYDSASGKKLFGLKEDAYLTYVTQVQDQLLVQYVTSEGTCYGKLYNNQGKILAELPYLSDVIGEELYFDYPSGSIKKTGIYDKDSLVKIAKEAMDSNNEMR